MSSVDRKGIVYTFYSYKGGAGRTMALANTAALLAKWGNSVLVVDWDLEAPGLERFFSSGDHSRSIRTTHPGVLDLLSSWAKESKLDWRQCVFETESGVSLISAGKDDGTYVGKVQQLNFDQLFEERRLGEYIEELRQEWITQFDFVLIDSRTGVTDIGGICTVHLPDTLVLFFTATDSSTEGVLDVVQRARKAQEHLPLDRGRLIAIPVPARDESRTEYERATSWKKIYEERFGDLYRDWLPSSVSVDEAIKILRIPYVPYWSFGEQLPVLVEGTRDPSSIGYAYEVLARLLEARLDWHKALEGRTLAPPPLPEPRTIDLDWLGKHRDSAVNGLKNTNRSGFMEAYHFCNNAIVNRDQSELSEIASQAAVHTFGWPIGIVSNREDARPLPTNDGIVAEIHSIDGAYDYWTLTKSGDFYTLMSLFEDERGENIVFFDTRIVRVTEAILHCINLYKRFGVEPTASITLSMRHGGLRGRTLCAASPYRIPARSARKNLSEDEVNSPTVVFRVGAKDQEIVNLVKTICDPLFIVFDFAKYSNEIYSDIVLKFLKESK
jgi:cellulose biosynthesis protein BcsQ